MAEDTKYISIITVNLNGKKLLKELLKSVSSLDYPSDKVELIIVDNGSSDGSVEYLKSSHPEIVVIRNQTNKGFAQPCNHGAATAKGEYIAFVNNDMQLEPGWLKGMVRRMDPDNGAVCVGSTILNADGTSADFMGGGINFVGQGFQEGFGRKASEQVEPEPKDILFACGGAMLIDRAVFLDAGGFDEDYFAFYEDVDLGWRLWVLGYRVVFAPDAVAYHKHHQTAKRFPPHKIKLLCERNILYTVYKNYSEENLSRILPAALLLCAGRSLLSSQVDLSDYALETGQGEHISFGNKKGIRYLYRKVLWSVFGFLADMRPNTWVGLPRRGLAPVVAMGEFASNLESLKAKRDAVQTRRKRSDMEVSELFRYTFEPRIMEPPYRKFYEIIRNSIKGVTLAG